MRGKITLDARLRVFTVDGTNEPHVVRLFPPESCSCPARTSCYHITAARLAVGLSDSGTRRPLNLTQLRRNKRRRADKTSGQKRPRAGDVDIVPADDVDEDVATALTVTITANQQQPPPRLQLLRTWNQVARRRQLVVCGRADMHDARPSLFIFAVLSTVLRSGFRDTVLL